MIPAMAKWCLDERAVRMNRFPVLEFIVGRYCFSFRIEHYPFCYYYRLDFSRFFHGHSSFLFDAILFIFTFRLMVTAAALTNLNKNESRDVSALNIDPALIYFSVLVCSKEIQIAGF